MKPPYSEITKLVGGQSDDGDITWAAFDTAGKPLLTLSKHGMEHLCNHPMRRQTLTLQLHDDPEAEKLIVLGPESTLEVNWSSGQ
ncbi:hypothetical protein N9917_04735 [Deltaproteobacteria bacterium]|nr:hypothetical protein [Deltaproteobacteria bacterium]